MNVLHPRAFLAAAGVAACLLLSDQFVQAARTRQAGERPTLNVDRDTRLLVLAPHPDDETLSSGGLMQRVREAGGEVHVLFLTDGDGYPEGVRVEDHVESPSPSDYRGYGQRRKREARAALAELGVDPAWATFLSFPDAGLTLLMKRYWSERRAAFRSPYTRLDRPPKADITIADTEYRGEDLTQELARAIGEYQPTMILVPRKEDQHPDHCAAWFFLMDSLNDVERVHPGYTPDVVNYIIHWYSWPYEDEGAELAPPPGLRGGISGWMRSPLTRQQQRTKRAALQHYQTQMLMMRWFLNSFVRANEVFSRPAPARVVLPLPQRRNPCGE